MNRYSSRVEFVYNPEFNNLFFSRIVLTDYKNYQVRSFDFSQRIVGISGRNGKGKTNLLDAINYLCFTKSYFSKSDTQNVRFDAPGFRLEAILTGWNDHHDQQLVCVYRVNAKKEFSVNEVPYEKFSHHVGKFPCVMIAPDDIEMITGGSEERRRYLDTLISQVDARYLQLLMAYNKILLQRNSLLKNETVIAGRGNDLLDILTKQLIEPGNEIHRIREEYAARLMPLINEFYHEISGNSEDICLSYYSPLQSGSFEQLLSASMQKDRILQRTNVGVHKDDLFFLLGDKPFKSVASQGQRKSLLFACKLAEFEMLRQIKGFAPFLLLDDVFEKLDETRMRNLLNFVCCCNDGQVFITDTHEDRLRAALSQFGQTIQIIELE